MTVTALYEHTAAQLRETAAAMVAPGKGILAADERGSTMGKRLEKVGVSGDAETRRAWRDLIVTTPGLSEGISGIILSDETFTQETLDGVPFPKACEQAGVLPGIKVDGGTKPLPGSPDETMTEGLDGLRDRLASYRDAGARFAKWRAVIRIDEQAGLPTDTCLQVNAHALARYAALCQEAGVVPIVEPEVLMDGDHTIAACERVTGRALQPLFAELIAQGTLLEGLVLKPNMVAPALSCPEQVGEDVVAEATVRCFRRFVPAAVPGIAFLSGGQGPEAATRRLQELNATGPQPWQLTFSYGRALLDPALQAWKGEGSNREAGQQALAHRVRATAAARSGTYTPDLERA